MHNIFMDNFSHFRSSVAKPVRQFSHAVQIQIIIIIHFLEVDSIDTEKLFAFA